MNSIREKILKKNKEVGNPLRSYTQLIDSLAEYLCGHVCVDTFHKIKCSEQHIFLEGLG